MWQGILTTMSQTNGGYTYDYATVPFLAEFMKVKNTQHIPHLLFFGILRLVYFHVEKKIIKLQGG